ncbi:hypothetical protein FGG08_002400 [Glutinoglossum americanum]|uniref:SAC domain-containing protein n=1 Tax=Glutinoglossum americanum TaxID=1670608 RepID=A0A9P8I4P8_9PEZI|nr:hypothetical protein FGG08_002400 [Glutinoglossum americanum]
MRRLLIVAAVDGLVLQPLGQRNSFNPPAVEISYNTNSISPLRAYNPDNAVSSFEAHGVVGMENLILRLLNVSSNSFLITISGRQQVAQIRGKSIFVITGVALIPLASQAEASAAIIETRDSFQRSHKIVGEVGEHIDGSDSSSESTDGNGEFSDDDLCVPTPPELLPDTGGPRFRQRRTSIAEDVIGKKGLYGRFAEKWFSRKGWDMEKMRMQGMSTEDGVKGEELPVKKGDAALIKSVDIDRPVRPLGSEGQNKEQVMPEAGGVGRPPDGAASTLLPKLLRTTKLLLGSSRGFFYSYDHDITRNLESQDPNVSGIPLYKVADPLVSFISLHNYHVESQTRKFDLGHQYFWNRHLVLPFIEAGQHALVLPIMQGFVGQRTFSVSSPIRGITAKTKDPASDKVEANEHGGLLQEETRDASDTELLLTLISRRSVKRAGLRYLRRGVDDGGNTANSVETEQILSGPLWSPCGKVYSFVQMRGSIPLYFTQSPYSLKPVPIIQHSPSINQSAFKKHFSNLAGRYGDIQVVSLVEKNGIEAQVGMEYQKNIDILNHEGGAAGANARFEWFDFHAGNLDSNFPISRVLNANSAVVCRGMKFEKVSLLVDSLGHVLDEFGCTIKIGEKTQIRQRG